MVNWLKKFIRQRELAWTYYWQLFVIIFLVMFVQSAFGQTSPRNLAFVEVGGNGMFASVNYERQLTKIPLFSIRAGLGVYAQSGRTYLTVPIGANLLLKLKRFKNSYVDLGFGITGSPHNYLLFGDNQPATPYTVVYVPSIGYRRHTRSLLMWRVSITPLNDRYAADPWFGFSLGKHF